MARGMRVHPKPVRRLPVDENRKRAILQLVAGTWADNLVGAYNFTTEGVGEGTSVHAVTARPNVAAMASSQRACFSLGSPGQ